MKALKKLSLGAILGLAFYLVTVSYLSAQPAANVVSAGFLDGPRLLLVAPSGNQSTTEPIDVQVVVTGTVGLSAFEFDLVLDRSLLDVNDLSIEPLLGGTVNCDPDTSRCAFSLGPLAQPDAASLGGYSFGTGGGTPSDGTLAVIHLLPTSSSGTSTLHLVNPRLADVNGNLIVPEVLSTTVTISDTVSVSYDVFLPLMTSGTGTSANHKPRSSGRIDSLSKSGINDPTDPDLAFSARLLASTSINMTPVDSHLALAVTGINPDVNGDRLTDIVDIQLVASCWGMDPGDPGCSILIWW